MTTSVASSPRAMNLSRLLERTAMRFPNRPGFVWGDKDWTWRDLELRVAAMAHVLVERFGTRQGDRILVHSRNCNQLFELMFACFRIGAVFVPTNFRLTGEEVAYQAEASGAVGFVCGAEFADYHGAVCAAASNVRFVIAIGEAAFGSSYDDLVEEHLGCAVPAASVQYDTPCWFLFTSGTTGKPKAAILTHGQMAFVINNHLCDVIPGTNEEDVSLILGPLSHGAGVHQLLQVAKGAASVLPQSDSLDPARIWALVEEWEVTNAFTVPTILKMLVDHPAVDAHDHSSLRYIVYAGSPMYEADQAQALAKLGPVLVQYYGLGEVTGAITVLPASDHRDGRLRTGTAGFARTGMEIEIQDDDGNVRPVGETGEICVAGPAVFAGYHDNPEANEKAFRNGWFRTGDLGHVDAEGYLFITGRASDMYISGGSNVYPREIEEHLLQHAAVTEVAVVGVPDSKWGEVGVAVCVLEAGAAASDTDLREWLDGKIARYKMPRRFLFWAELPKSGYGKVPKTVVKQMIEAA